MQWVSLISVYQEWPQETNNPYSDRQGKNCLQEFSFFFFLLLTAYSVVFIKLFRVSNFRNDQTSVYTNFVTE